RSVAVGEGLNGLLEAFEKAPVRVVGWKDGELVREILRHFCRHRLPLLYGTEARAFDVSRSKAARAGVRGLARAWVQPVLGSAAGGRDWRVGPVRHQQGPLGRAWTLAGRAWSAGRRVGRGGRRRRGRA